MSSRNRAGVCRRQRDMIRSRRLALAAVVVVLGLSACGDPNTTTPLADQPQVIQLASGQTGTGGAAPAAETMDAADSKMALFGPIEFVYDGELLGLDTPAGSWLFPTGAQPDPDRIAKLAAALGVEGEVRTLSQEQGGGWAVGPEDYSAAVLTVGSDGMLSWWLSAAPTTSVGYACGVSTGVSEPAVGTDDAGSSGAVPDVAPPAYTDSEGDTPVAVDAPTATVAGDVVAPDCPTPEPPVGVPTKDEALAKAKQLFVDWGYDVDSFQFDDPYADEWGASVSASLLLDGMKAPIMLSVGFGENGTVTYASGSLAEPQRGADYPTIGAAAGLERLKTQQNQYVGLGSPEARSAVDVAASDAGVATAVAPDIAPCEPEAAAADCAPVPSGEPVTVTLNSVKSDLTMVWAADNTIWLLPAYSFGSADGGIYTVIAVEDAYLHQADPVPATGQTDPAVDPGVVPTPETAVAVPADGTTCATYPPTTDAPATVEQIADAIVGLCFADAQAFARNWAYEVRVVRQDGVDLNITADFSESRINVAIEGDIVAEVVSIG
jgi:hypothetical protein